MELKGRLLAISELVEPNSIVLDVGTDHAYLPIYLCLTKKCLRAYASDISVNALKNAQNNVEKYQVNNLKLILSDGLKNINEDYDTLVLSGMGTKTIIKILEGNNLPLKIIISSNNNLYELRTYMNKLGYAIKKEIISYDNQKYYDIISYYKKNEKLSKTTLKYGKAKDKKYYAYLLKKEQNKFWKVSICSKLKLIPSIICLFYRSII